MIDISSAQLDLWLATLMFPLTRLLALIASAPILGNKQIPLRVKVGLAVLLSLVIAPTLAPMPNVQLGSPEGLLIMVQQIIIGTAMGFSMRLVFTAIEMAGQLSGMQMGLGFASFYDPLNANSNIVTAQFLGIIASLAFLSIDGHLLMIRLVTESFRTLPVGEAMPLKGYYSLVEWGASVFSYGAQISIPVMAALLITNLALGILTRAAQQLNPFAIGFPITLMVGFFIMSFSLPHLSVIMDRLTGEGLAYALKMVTPAK